MTREPFRGGAGPIVASAQQWVPVPQMQGIALSSRHRRSPHRPTRPIHGPASSTSPQAPPDPLEAIRMLATPPHADRKALQLCRQVERIASLVISGELDDDLLRNLTVISVVPAPHTSHLLITLITDGPVSEEDLLRINVRALQYNGRVRTAVATAIQRRKAPQLTLRVVSPSIVLPSEEPEFGKESTNDNDSQVGER